jgi:hypothetical protein
MIKFLRNLFDGSLQKKKDSDPEMDEVLRSVEQFKNRRIYKVLTTDILAGLKDEEIEQVVFDNISANIGDDTHREREKVGALTRGQRAIYVTWMVEAEVNNGGFNQFYFNSSGQLADLAEEAFKTIGADQFADLVKKANSIYKEIKEDLEKYNDGTIESFSNSYKGNPLNDLDSAFYKLDDSQLNQLRLKYIKENVNEFVDK